ncbi:MAG: hypothetical protein KJ710_08540 [Candidatus Omnitrophica bacterium]|nr:hypothetical protein [Candidatus Omnitrophota bacterium]
MKKLIAILFFLSFTTISLAGTVGNPDLSIPADPSASNQEKLYSKPDPKKESWRLLYSEPESQDKKADHYKDDSSFLSLKTGLEIEFIGERELSSSSEVTAAKIEGRAYMVKISNDIWDIFEPYAKIGLSDLEVKWTQNSNSVTVETDRGPLYVGGAKVTIGHFKDSKVKLTLDGQYRKYDLNIDTAKIEGSTVTASAQNKVFEIEEWQASLLASKRLIVPLGMREYYISPYAGVTFSSIDADVYFKQSTTALEYSTYVADDKNPIGILFGCGIMPFSSSRNLLNFEVRLANETAVTISGIIRF